MSDLDPIALPATVLVPLDGSPYADRALPVGRALASAGAMGLRLLGVADGDDAERLSLHLATAAAAGDGEATWEMRSGSPADEIVTVAAASGALVCLASHGRGRLATAVLGSTAAHVIASIGAPVVVVGPAVSEVPMGERARILACVDGSPGSEAVLPVVRAWAIRLGLPVSVVTVAEPVPAGSGDDGRYARRFGPEEAAEHYVERLAAGLSTDAVEAEGIALYDAISVHEGLVGHLRTRPATLVAVTTHARTGLPRAVLGSVAAKIAAESLAPVLVVPLPG